MMLNNNNKTCNHNKITCSNNISNNQITCNNSNNNSNFSNKITNNKTIKIKTTCSNNSSHNNNNFREKMLDFIMDGLDLAYNKISKIKINIDRNISYKFLYLIFKLKIIKNLVNFCFQN